MVHFPLLFSNLGLRQATGLLNAHPGLMAVKEEKKSQGQEKFRSHYRQDTSFVHLTWQGT